MDWPDYLRDEAAKYRQLGSREWQVEEIAEHGGYPQIHILPQPQMQRIGDFCRCKAL